MAGFVSYNSFDYRSVDIVPVIASFDTEGHMLPLFVRIKGESFKIESAWAQNCFRNVIEYKCKLIDGDLLKPLALTFYREEGMWTMSL